MVNKIQFWVTYLDMMLMVNLWRGFLSDSTYNNGTSCTNRSGRERTGTKTDHVYPIRHSLDPSLLHKKSRSWGRWPIEGLFMIKMHRTLSTWVSHCTIRMNLTAPLTLSLFHKHLSKLKFRCLVASKDCTHRATTYSEVCILTRLIWYLPVWTNLYCLFFNNTFSRIRKCNVIVLLKSDQLIIVLGCDSPRWVILIAVDLVAQRQNQSRNVSLAQTK